MSERSSPGDAACVLAVNAGSSSIKFALYDLTEPLQRRLRGQIERIGLPGTKLTVDGPTGTRAQSRTIDARGHSGAACALIDWLDAARLLSAVKAVGHRVVHGVKHSEPERVTPKLLAELHRITPYAPNHLPREIGRRAARSFRDQRRPARLVRA